MDSASCYRTALEMHYGVIEQCALLDPARCARQMRSKRHFSTKEVEVIEDVKNRYGKDEASAQLVSHLSKMNDDGVLYFVEHYLTGQGLEDVAATIRLCPGPNDCTLDAADYHRQDGSSEALIAIDPFSCSLWPPIHVQLVEDMEPLTVRLKSYGRGLLTDVEKQLLQDEERNQGNRLRHNDMLLDFLRPGGRRAFELLLLVLGDMGPNFATPRSKMADLLSRK